MCCQRLIVPHEYSYASQSSKSAKSRRLQHWQFKLSNLQHNKALHPTAYSFVPCARSSLRSLRFRRRVSLVVVLRASVSRTFDVGFVSRCCLPARGGSTRVEVVMARTWRRWLFRSSVPEPNNTQHNQALHPTARSLRVFRLSGSGAAWSWLAGGG